MRSALARTLVAVVVLSAALGAAWFYRDLIGLASPGERDAAPAPAAETAPTPAHAGHDGRESVPASATADEEPRAAVDVSAEQQARIGLKSQVLRRTPIEHTIRAVGIVEADERLEAHVHTRIPGYVEQIEVDAVGDRVEKGQVLYRLYSPELVSTQREYLAAAGRGQLSDRIAEGALERLALWDVPAAQIARLKQTRKVQRAMVFRSPVDGFVLAKNVLLGMYVTPEMELYHLADLSRIWVIVTLYEDELGLVGAGDPARIDVNGIPDHVIDGTIDYVYPEVDLATRTAKARVVVENGDYRLKPGMYATITVNKPLGAALVVPEDAVVDTGVRRLVLVQHGPTRFVPREVELGPRVQGGWMVRGGVDEGEAVVVRASFLVDSESRLQAALQRGAGEGGHAGHGG